MLKLSGNAPKDDIVANGAQTGHERRPAPIEPHAAKELHSGDASRKSDVLHPPPLERSNNFPELTDAHPNALVDVAFNRRIGLAPMGEAHHFDSSSPGAPRRFARKYPAPGDEADRRTQFGHG